MNARLRILCSWLVPAILLAASACNMQTTPAAIVATPNLPPPATAIPPTAKFLGAIPVGLPAERADQAGDVDSSPNAYKKVVSGGDEFVNGLYERPFNANTMDKYFPYLDIVETQGFKDDTWGYATITLANNDANGGLPGQYAIELDLNKDGRGDWLIRASNLEGTEWTTQGVQAWKDPDGDIGSSIPMVADTKPHGGDGYETLVFDQGKGDLVDGAWARINPDDPKTVEIAFKLSMVGNASSYAMGAWAGTNIDPALFDYNDHMTHIQAGSPNPGDMIYPIKQMAEIDNTCRLAIGFTPSTNIPGLCETVQKRQAEGGSTCVPHSCPAATLANNCVPVTCP